MWRGFEARRALERVQQQQAKGSIAAPTSIDKLAWQCAQVFGTAVENKIGGGPRGGNFGGDGWVRRAKSGRELELELQFGGADKLRHVADDVVDAHLQLWGTAAQALQVPAEAWRSSEHSQAKPAYRVINTLCKAVRSVMTHRTHLPSIPRHPACLGVLPLPWMMTPRIGEKEGAAADDELRPTICSVLAMFSEAAEPQPASFHPMHVIPCHVC